MSEFDWDLSADEEDHFSGLDAEARFLLIRSWVDRAIRMHMASAFGDVGEEQSARCLRELPNVAEDDTETWCSAVMRTHLCALLEESQLQEVALFLREEAERLELLHAPDVAEHIFQAASKVHGLLTHLGPGAVGLLLSGTHAALMAVGHALSGSFDEAAHCVEDVARTSPQLRHLIALGKSGDLPDPNALMCECIDAGTEGAIEEGNQQRADVRALKDKAQSSK
jgi:hypothetical protein